MRVISGIYKRRIGPGDRGPFKKGIPGCGVYPGLQSGMASSAYRTPEGAMLEELVKKLPGAEIDDEGNVKINGKDLSKIFTLPSSSISAPGSFFTNSSSMAPSGVR